MPSSSTESSIPYSIRPAIVNRHFRGSFLLNTPSNRMVFVRIARRWFFVTEKQKLHIQDMLLQGMTYSQISNSLSMSVNTVKSFCQRNAISTSNKMRCAGNKEKCKHCGKQLIQSAKGKARTFCCNQCRYAWWNRHRHQPNRKASYRLTCAYCGREFISYGAPNRKYCAHACYISDRFDRNPAVGEVVHR